MALTTTATLRATIGTARAPGAATIVGVIVIPARYAPRPEFSIRPNTDRRFGVIDVVERGSPQLTR